MRPRPVAGVCHTKSWAVISAGLSGAYGSGRVGGRDAGLAAEPTLYIISSRVFRNLSGKISFIPPHTHMPNCIDRERERKKKS
jgi:hypothetical protein